MLDTNINSKHTVYYIIPIAISFRFLWLYDGCKWNTLVRWQCRLSLGWSIIIIQTCQWKVHDLSLEVCLTDGRMYTRLFCQTIYRIAGPYFSSSTFVAALGLFIEAWSLLCLSSASASAMRVLIETARGNDSGVFLYSFYAYQILVWKIRLRETDQGFEAGEDEGGGRQLSLWLVFTTGMGWDLTEGAEILVTPSWPELESW